MLKLDHVTGMLAMPWWIAAALLAGLLVFGILAFLRLDTGRIAGIAAIAFVLALGWGLHERLLSGDQAAERRALDARIGELALRATTPASALACLAAQAGETVEHACERAIFATPESTAAALAYAQAHLDLLRDVQTRAVHGRDYERILAALRRPVESDRFGVFAQTFLLRDNCRADRCDAAASLLADRARIMANLKDDAFQGYVGKYAVLWEPQSAPGMAAAAPAAKAPSAPAASSSLNFPSAASIPPVSIMNSEPGRPGQNGMENEANMQLRTQGAIDHKPAARGANVARRPAADASGRPVPIAPPRPQPADVQ